MTAVAVPILLCRCCSTVGTSWHYCACRTSCRLPACILLLLLLRTVATLLLT
jgi:hypothetical protein